MFNRILPRVCGLVLGVSMMMAVPASADPLKDEIAPTGKLRVAIAISPAGGAFWSTKTEAGGYAGVPVDLGKEMAAQLGVPVEYVAHQNSGQIVDAVSKGTWDVTFLPKDPEREARMSFGPIYEVADATYIVKAGSPADQFQTLDQPGTKVAAVNNTTTMRGAIAHLKNAKVTGYQTYDEIFGLLKNGEVDAFALSRDQLNAMAKKLPGTRVLDETFKQTVTAVAVPPNHPLALAFATKFLTDATTNGTLRKAYDNNGLKDTPIRVRSSRAPPQPSLRAKAKQSRVPQGGMDCFVASAPRNDGVGFDHFAPTVDASRYRLHAAIDDNAARRRRGEKPDQRLAGLRLFGYAGDPGGKHRDLLHLRRQLSDDVDTGDGLQFADLLEADLGVAAGDDFAHRRGRNLPAPCPSSRRRCRVSETFRWRYRRRWRCRNMPPFSPRAARA